MRKGFRSWLKGCTDDLGGWVYGWRTGGRWASQQRLHFPTGSHWLVVEQGTGGLDCSQPPPSLIAQTGTLSVTDTHYRQTYRQVKRAEKENSVNLIYESNLILLPLSTKGMVCIYTIQTYYTDICINTQIM